VAGVLDEAARPISEGGLPDEMASEPSAATMAPLSVQRSAGGIRISIFAFAQRSFATARNLELAATPPAINRESIPGINASLERLI